VRKVSAAGMRVIPVPGPSSLAAALSVAGLEHGAALFVGFLPHASRERTACLQMIASSTAATVLFEAPHRLASLAAGLAAVLAPTRRVLIARELTKKFETVETITAGELVRHVEASEPRGEYVLIVGPVEPAPQATEIDAVARRWLVALADALPPARAATVAARATGLPRDVLYRALTQIKPTQDGSAEG
jgi:16S rRNA (cytidine1402-2'-O)-methyltransferase